MNSTILKQTIAYYVTETNIYFLKLMQECDNIVIVRDGGFDW